MNSKDQNRKDFSQVVGFIDAMKETFGAKVLYVQQNGKSLGKHEVGTQIYFDEQGRAYEKQSR